MNTEFTIRPENEVKISQQDIDDIMVCALEGGISYWCCEAEVIGEYLGEYASDQISRGGCKQCIYESMYVAGFNFAYRCMCNFLFLYGTNTRDDTPEHWRPSWCPISQNVKGERYENNHRRSF